MSIRTVRKIVILYDDDPISSAPQSERLEVERLGVESINTWSIVHQPHRFQNQDKSLAVTAYGSALNVLPAQLPPVQTNQICEAKVLMEASASAQDSIQSALPGTPTIRPPSISPPEQQQKTILGRASEKP